MVLRVARTALGRASVATAVLVVTGIVGAGGCGGPDCCHCVLDDGTCRSELVIPLLADSCEDACLEQASIGECNFTHDDIEVAEQSDQCVTPTPPPDPVPDGGEDADAGEPEPTVATAISGGSDHACALTEEGAVQCWGGNFSGQLGTNDLSRARPAVVAGLEGPVSAVDAGGDQSCALISGRVWCWGDNEYGLLGDDTLGSRSTPAEVPNLSADVVTVAMGGSRACVILDNGGVQCWGENSEGGLGDGTNVDSRLPVNVVDLDVEVTAIATGGLHTCALTVDGAVKCWGENLFGQLGNGSTSLRSLTPVDVEGLTGVVALHATGATTCALTDAPSVWCWGLNSIGQVGDGSREEALVPVEVPGLVNPVAVACGGLHCCAATDAGVECWGGNSDGGLGDGTTQSHDIPSPVIGLEGYVTALATGGGYTCALTDAGRVFCWGDISGADNTATEVLFFR